MKKTVCLFLACVMLLGLTAFARAESDLETQLAGLDLQAPALRFYEKPKAVLSRSELGSSTDTVSISADEVRVVTEEGLCLSYAPPTENVICLTQDIEQQAFLYLLLFSENVLSISDSFVLDGMHLNIYDQETGTDIYINVGVSALSERLQNLAFLSDDDVRVLQRALEDNYFPDAASVSPGTVGNSLWFFADYESGGILLTYINGLEVVCSFRYTDSTGPVPAITLLENLTLSVV